MCAAVRFIFRIDLVFGVVSSVSVSRCTGGRGRIIYIGPSGDSDGGMTVKGKQRRRIYKRRGRALVVSIDGENREKAFVSIGLTFRREEAANAISATV